MTEFPPIGLGTYENTDPEDCEAAVSHALDIGYRHVDTAEGYENETYVGDGIRHATVDRERVIIATKVSPNNLGYNDVITHAKASAERIGIDTIDLLYVHWPIGAYDPDETLPALDSLVESGIVRHIGLSNFTPAQLETAIDRLDNPVFAHQVECHPLLQQEQLRRLARKFGHHLVAYSPLAKGTITAVSELVDIANAHNATPAQVSLAWLMAKESVVAIPKSAEPARIEENFEARNLQLSTSAHARIDGIDRERRHVDFPSAPWNS